jgi:hypothetical protein
MTGKEYQAYLVKLALEAWDAGASPKWERRGKVERREDFERTITERMAQAATVYTCDVEAARLNIPTDEEAERAQAHEMELRAAEGPACEYCGSREAVAWTEDPYESDLNNDHSLHHICASCLDSRADEL